jgi:PAS domain S-box-containing protein
MDHDASNPADTAPPASHSAESAALFEGLFLQAPLAASLSRLQDGCMLAVNDAWVRLTGFAREEVIGRTAQSLGFWSDSQARDTALSQAAEDAAVLLPLALGGGPARTVRMHSRVLPNTSPALLLVYLTDVTREIAAEQALQASHLALRKRVELHAATEKLARVGHWTNATNEESVSWSEGLHAIAGVPPQKELLRTDGRSGIHPDDLPAWVAARDAMDGREVEFRWIRPDGVQRWFRTRIGQTAVAGNPQTVFGVVQDVTAEHDARQAQAAQLRLIENIAARVPGAMYQVRIPVRGLGEFLYVSPAVRDLMELEPLALMGDAGQLLTRIHPQDVPAYTSTLRACTDELRPWIHEFRMLLPHRGLRWCRVEAMPQREPDGNTLWHGYASDITEGRLAEQRLERQQRMLEAVRLAQAIYIDADDKRWAFEGLLEAFVGVTGSAYGFVGEVYYNEDGTPYLRTHAISNIAWDEASRLMYESQMDAGMAFRNLRSLFGQVMVTGQPVIANDPRHDLRSGGLPAGHPPMDAFLGMPLVEGDRMVAMVGLANQPGGYSPQDIEFLQPLLGTVRQLVLAWRSHADRNRARAALELTSEDLAKKSSALQLTLNSMAQGLALMDPDGHIRIYNRRFLELLDLPETLMASHPRHNQVVDFQRARGDFGAEVQLVDPSLRPFVSDALNVQPPEVYLRATHQGATIEVRTRFLPEGGWVRTYTDMTPYVQAQQALDAERQRLQWVLDATRCGIWETNLETGASTVNDHWANMLGHVLDDIQPVSIDTWRSLVHPQDIAYAEDMLQRHLRGETDFYDVDIRMRHKSGRWVWINDRGRVHRRDAAGKALFISGTHLDIDERVAAQEQVRLLNASLELRVAERTADLERSMKDMEAISYSIAHDLRAPLRSVNGFSALIQEEAGDRLDPLVRDMFGRINRSSRNMGQMITDMLELLRVVRAELDAVPVDMQGLAQTVVEQLAPDLPGADIRVGPLPTVMGDATLLRQVLLNLMDNAVKYSRHRPAPVIALSFDPAKQAFRLRDNGMGFDMARAQKLFGLFQRLHPSSDVPGTGVGLAIVARIVERHGGRIWAESAPDAGTSFWWTLPTT